MYVFTYFSCVHRYMYVYLVRKSSDVVTPNDEKLGEVPGDVSGHPGGGLEPREQRVRPEPVDIHL